MADPDNYRELAAIALNKAAQANESHRMQARALVGIGYALLALGHEPDLREVTDEQWRAWAQGLAAGNSPKPEEGD